VKYIVLSFLLLAGCRPMNAPPIVELNLEQWHCSKWVRVQHPAYIRSPAYTSISCVAYEQMVGGQVVQAQQ
jgi:hypothetical protein